MPSRPPETKFYSYPDNAMLWRDISRVFEDFCGEDEMKWPDRQNQFKTVVNDILERLNQSATPITVTANKQGVKI